MKIHAGKLVLLLLTLCLLPAVLYSATNTTYSEQDDNDGEVNQYREGWIDWLQGDTFVIDDSQYIRTDNTRYYDKNFQSVSSGHFSVDMYVQFEADENYQLTAVYEKEKNADELPVSERHFRQSQNENAVKGNPGSSGSEVYQDGGVWRN